MKLFAVTFLFVPLSCFSQISNESKNLAWCEGVYVYYAQLFQMKNNEGLAKNLFFRSSRVVAANMFLNLENGIVSDDKVRQFKEVRKNMKARFDSQPDLYFNEIAKCDSSVQSSISAVRMKNQTWDGLKFDDLQQKMMQTYLRSLGIR
jgi:hypothetical protein